MKNASIVAAALLLAWVGPAAGQVRIQVQHGWGGKERAGRWNPVVVRLSSPLPQDVMIELRWAQEGGFGSLIHEHVAIGPTPASFELFAPSHYSSWEQSVLVVRDASSEKWIAQYPPHLRRPAPPGGQLGPQGIFMGVTGRPAPAEMLTQVGDATTGYLPPRLIPRAAIGFDSLEILFLNQPNLDELDFDQQRAILDWVRAGGSLLFSPGEGSFPQGNSLVQALPCQVQAISQVELSAPALESAGLPPRFGKLTGHVLAPKPGAQPLQLLGDAQVTAWTGRLGLGRLMVVPIDVAALDFVPAQQAQKSPAFWQPILARLASVAPPQSRRKFDAPFYGYQSESEDQQREGAAISTLCDVVAGSSTPAHAAPLALLAILLVIGPVDSILLYAAGRRHWTWTTLAGWVAFIVVGAFAARAFLVRAPVDYRTVRLIDQVEDKTVATTDLIGASTPTGGQIPIGDDDSSPPGWWQALAPGTLAPASASAQPDARFHQRDAGNAPEPLDLLRGRPRYLHGDQRVSGDPMLDVSLSLQSTSGAPPHLVGTLKNLSAQTLTGVRLRTRFGVVLVPLGPGGALAPTESISLDLPAAGAPFNPLAVEGQYQNYGSFGSHHQNQAINPAELWILTGDLSGRRSLRIDELIDKSTDFVCVYAQAQNPNSAAAGNIAGAERYIQWLRVIATLKP